MKRLTPFLLVAALSIAWAQPQWEYAFLIFPEVDPAPYNIVTPTESYNAETPEELYRLFTGAVIEGVGLVHFFNVLGARRWELVSSTRIETTGDPLYIFKRPR